MPVSDSPLFKGRPSSLPFLSPSTSLFPLESAKLSVQGTTTRPTTKRISLWFLRPIRSIGSAGSRFHIALFHELGLVAGREPLTRRKSWLMDFNGDDDDCDGFGFGYYSEDDLAGSDDDCVSAAGKQVERLKLSEHYRKRLKANADELEDGSVDDLDSVESNCDEDLWTMVPDDVMRAILYRLPFSSFCSFRSVCEKWNTLVVYPDPNQTESRNHRDVPVCVLSIGSNEFLCYNPYLHSWHCMPTSFGSSFGTLGFSNDESRVVAGTSGLLVLKSHHMGLWVVNPINKTERRLPDEGVCGRILKVHIHLNESRESYRVYVVWDVDIEFTRRGYGKFELHVYDSRKKSWVRYCWISYRNDFPGSNTPIQAFCNLTSAVEHERDVFCLLSNDMSKLYRLTMAPSVDAHRVAQENVKSCYVCLPLLPEGLFVGQLFAWDGGLRLGGVTFSSIRGYVACVWELDTCHKWKWCESAHMSLDTFDPLSLQFKPSVSVRGDFMWIANRSSEGGWNGVMCHIPSNSWWKLPELCQTIRIRLQFDHEHQDNELSEVDYYGRTCEPFLFDPKLGLAA